MVRLDIPTPERMRALGRALGKAAEAGDRFMLEGPFGAGKTTFVQGLAEGLEIKTPVASPSFVIETQYHGRLTLYHVDLFRLDRVEPELLQSLEEHMYGDAVTAVEWAERMPAEVLDGSTQIRFEVVDSGRRVGLETNEPRIAQAARAV